MQPFPTTTVATVAIVVTLVVLSLPGTTPSSIATDTTTTTTTSTESSTYLPNCTQPFSCGHLHNLSYPFSGGDRPSYCGLPELNLACQNGSALLTMDSLVYLVNEVDQTEKTMSLSRMDLYNTTCTTQLLDTTLNSAVLSLTSNDKNLTLSYACNGSWDGKSLKPSNLFSCDINGAPSDAYYLIGLIPNEPILDYVRCNLTVRTPVLANRVGTLDGNGSLLGEVLREGFEVSYGGNYGKAECEACLRRPGGECGFDPDDRRVVCICGGWLCSEKDSKNTALPIGIGIGGAAVFGIFLGFLFLIVVQRRKRKAAAENQSKDLLSQPPISKNKNVHTPPVDLSLSIPPYPYSKSCPKSDPQKESSYFGLQVFSFTELEEATDNFNPDKELGSGGYGSVYHGILRDGRSVAVKRLFDNSMKREEQFMNEVEILNRLRHRNLVTLYGCTSRRTRELVFVYEYVPNGTVADHIHGDQSKSRFLEWPIRLSIAIETADALAYLHTSDVIHRDVKTNNILLDSKFRVKVADFGLSRLFPTNATHVSTAPQGTPGYVDPEYYNTYQLTDKSDVYSFGVVLVELISSLPAVDTSRHRLNINLANMAVTKIQSGSITELIDPRFRSDKDNAVQKMTTSIAELAFRCLQQERDMRPTMNEVHETLRRIQTENCPTVKCETVIDIGEDNVSLLKQVSPPLSPDSLETDQWISSSTLSSS